jgi:hypothetical protein
LLVYRSGKTYSIVGALLLNSSFIPAASFAIPCASCVKVRAYLVDVMIKGAVKGF